MKDEIIRGTINGKAKYCRIPIRSKTAEQMQQNGITELSAETILAMPHDSAAKVIDAIIADWAYWLRRANELFVLQTGNPAAHRPEGSAR